MNHETEVDVMVFVRWFGDSPLSKTSELVWVGEQSAILIIPLSVYHSLRLFTNLISASLNGIYEIQLIKPRKK